MSSPCRTSCCTGSSELIARRADDARWRADGDRVVGDLAAHHAGRTATWLPIGAVQDRVLAQGRELVPVVGRGDAPAPDDALEPVHRANPSRIAVTRASW